MSSVARIVAILIVMFCLVSLSATDIGSRTMVLTLDPSVADRYEIGFSTGIVDALNQTVQGISGNVYELSKVENEYKCVDKDNIYVYWKIVSNLKLNLYVNVSGLLTGPSERLGWDVSVPDGSKKITITEAADGSSSIEFIGVGSDQTRGLLLYEYTGRPNMGLGIAGSQKLKVSTADFSEKSAGTYTAQIILSLVVVN